MVWQPHRACICGLLWTWMLLVGVDARSGSPGTRAIRRPINSASTHAAEATHSLPCGESVEVDAECGGMPQANVDWLRTGQSMEGGDHKCEEFKLMCVDQGSLVVHDPAHNILNGSDLPVFKFSPLEAVWRPPNHDELANAIYRGQTTIAPPIFRPPVAGDPKPIFSNCTLPIILFKSDESNYFHFMLSVMPQIYNWHAHGAVNRDVTYVLATAWGTEAPKFANPLLRPFSRYEVVSLADFSSRLPASFPSNSTGEGRHVRCFQKVVVCHVLDHLQSYPRSLDWAAPNYVYRWYHEKGLLPQNPADFTPLTEGREPRTPIRVLIETRNGTVRRLDNRESLIRECNADPGPWECRAFIMGSNFARDIAAIRTADVFVFVHGAAGANMVYMRNDTAVIEIDPRGFAGAMEGHWARLFFPDVAIKIGHRVWHFSLNIEDPELSWPAEWEKQGMGDGFFHARDRWFGCRTDMCGCPGRCCGSFFNALQISRATKLRMRRCGRGERPCWTWSLEALYSGRRKPLSASVPTE
eukprot:jgi/Botrbrau1/20028/Bobra.200_1s0033.2